MGWFDDAAMAFAVIAQVKSIGPHIKAMESGAEEAIPFTIPVNVTVRVDKVDQRLDVLGVVVRKK